MLNMYKSETKEFRHENIRVHPSFWFASAITRNTFGILFTIPIPLIASLFMLFSGIPALTIIGTFLVFWIAFVIVRFTKSYKMLGDTYNRHLYPLERRYYRMSKEDQKSYRNYLESAYKMCSHRGEMDLSRLRKIDKLFRLREIKASVLYDILDDELELAEEFARIQEDTNQQLQALQNKAKR
jgi:hypothetical protein